MSNLQPCLSNLTFMLGDRLAVALLPYGPSGFWRDVTIPSYYGRAIVARPISVLVL